MPDHLGTVTELEVSEQSTDNQPPLGEANFLTLTVGKGSLVGCTIGTPNGGRSVDPTLPGLLLLAITWLGYSRRGRFIGDKN